MKQKHIYLIAVTTIILCIILQAEAFSSYRSANYILSDAKILVSNGKATSGNYLLTDVEIGNLFYGKAQSANYTLEADPIIIKRKAPNAPIVNPVTSPTNISPQTLTGTKDPYTSIYINGYLAVPLNNNTSWSCSTALAEGNNDLFITAKNIYGLESASTYADIVLETTAPTGTIQINNDVQYTNSSQVNLKLSATDITTTTQMSFSNDNITYTTPENYSTSKTWTLTTGDGTKAVYVKYKDAAGNWSSPVSDTIILDTTAPEINIISPLENEVIKSE